MFRFRWTLRQIAAPFKALGATSPAAGPFCLFRGPSRPAVGAPYGVAATLHVAHWKSGPYWVVTTLKPSETL